jgi:hypothetical protein
MLQVGRACDIVVPLPVRGLLKSPHHLLVPVVA